ncbi:MAG: hypothetical protein K6U03_05075 [Firmicutes bacterium]|nr:hypothetical protein [Bacillota bacterium]
MPNDVVTILITANSPGEVAGWVRPAVAALKALPLESTIKVFIPPCPFASGAERRVVEAIPGVDAVIGPGSFMAYLFLGISPKGFSPTGRGIVLFLGGDLAYAALLARRLGYPAVAYTEGRAAWIETFALFAVAYPEMAEKKAFQRVPAEKIAIVGNLMVDAVRPESTRMETRGRLGVEDDRPLLLLMPGSRPAHVEYMVPFFLRVVEILRRGRCGFTPVLSLSPFVSEDHLAAALAGEAALRFGVTAAYSPGALRDDGKTDWERPGLIRAGGDLLIPVFRGRQYDLMAGADLALSLPGTNTVELSSLGVPMVVVLPLGHPEAIPLEGLAGLVGGIPFLGKALKCRLLAGISAKFPFAAWPNRLAGREIVPELKGEIAPEDVSAVTASLLAAPERRKEISARLREIVGGPGASERLAAAVLRVLRAHYGEDILNSGE